jgi:hypothetical protein
MLAHDQPAAQLALDYLVYCQIPRKAGGKSG